MIQKLNYKLKNSVIKINSTSSIIALAPMDGFTDIAMRLITYKYSPQFNTFFTEFTNVQGLFAKPSIHLINLLYPNPKLNPLRFTRYPYTIGQIFGNIDQIEYFTKAATALYLLGLHGIDLNMGCPAKNIIKQKSGAYLIGKQKSVKTIITRIKMGISRAEEIIEARQVQLWLQNEFKGSYKFIIDNFSVRTKPAKFTLSIKTRLGLDHIMPDEWWQFLDSLHLDFITVHARTVKQGYSGQSNLALLKHIQRIITTPIIGNGDIGKFYSLREALKITPFGIMIGRATIGKPYLLNEHFKVSDRNLYRIYREHWKLAFLYNPRLQKCPEIFLKYRYKIKSLP